MGQFLNCEVELMTDNERIHKLKEENKELHKHWQERFHPFRVEYELPIELY